MDALDRTLNWIAAPTEVRWQLEEYGQWLHREATPAGGLGPQEPSRILTRHVADSLLFAGVWDPDGTVLDVGTGVGLPGIPLAIAFPQRDFRLIDRSRRRVELTRRAVRVVGVTNVEVEQADIDDVDWEETVVVSRASLSPADLHRRAERLGPPRQLLVAGSHVAAPVVSGFETVEIPAEILDRPVWILRMAQS